MWFELIIHSRKKKSVWESKKEKEKSTTHTQRTINKVSNLIFFLFFVLRILYSIFFFLVAYFYHLLYRLYITSIPPAINNTPLIVSSISNLWYFCFILSHGDWTEHISYIKQKGNYIKNICIALFLHVSHFDMQNKNYII